MKMEMCDEEEDVIMVTVVVRNKGCGILISH
jgi:hypothetical protein